jgi:hypothetical protein
MSQVLRREFGVLAVLLFCLGTVRAEKAPSTGDYVRQIEKDLDEAEGYDAATGDLVRFFKSWVVLVIIAVVLVSGAVVINVVVWWHRRMSATTDPEKLAMSDPWVRAQLARQRAQEGGPPPIDQP